MDDQLLENTERRRFIFWKRKYFVPALILAAICLALFGWWGWHYLHTFVYTDDAMINGYRSNVSSQVLGQLTDLKVSVGDWVQTGEVVAVLDSSVQKAQLQVAEAQLAEARAAVQLARIDVDMKQADAQKAAAGEDKEKSQESQQIYDEAVVSHRVAMLDVASREASLRLARAQLDQTAIKAAMDGQVAMRWLYDGDIVSPGQPIVAIYDMSHLWVTAYLEETKIANVRVGDKATITVDAYPGLEFSGAVLDIGATTGQLFSVIPPQNASGNFTKVTQRIPVTLSISFPTDLKGQQIILRPGMSAEVKIQIQVVKDRTRQAQKTL
jgi:membrane fusion protein, multidrug efflux system